eukprot:INCI792.1.p1 GENE.INCI792.1~~INCI792.1.p1  ORF type:complete len:483 (-),score=82.34 INCI792.1:378-1826(-)
MIRTAPRVAVVGAGIGGLALSAMLARKLPGASLAVLERSHCNRDEGYGLDLDEHGQEALVRAGVFHRFWEVSRLKSNTWNTYPLRGDTPLFTKFSRVMEAESNRAGVRQLFLEALHERGASINYECHVTDARAAGDDYRALELLAKNGSSIGEFDLVVDACGLHSPLRHLRVDDPVGKHFSGLTLIHGVVDHPENDLPPEVVHRLGEGTLLIVGRGYNFVLQRFGADADDKRAAFFYQLPPREADDVQAEIGIEMSTSREAGILRAGEGLQKVQKWLHADMGNNFDPLYHAVIDGLSRVTVRGTYTHGSGTTLRSDTESRVLPLVCCGDSLRNIGLGGGGNLAIQDALAYTRVLTNKEGADGEKAGSAFDETGRLTASALEQLREAEAEALKRKHRHFDGVNKYADSYRIRPEVGVDANVSKLGDFAEKPHWKLLLNAGHAGMKAVGAFAKWRGWTEGADKSTPLHAQVRKAIEEEEASEQQ